MKKLKKNTMLIWVLSYLTIMLIPMICNGIIYNRAKKTIKEEFDVNSEQALEKFKIVEDNIFVNVSSIAKTLQRDDIIWRLYNMPEGTQYSEYSEDALSVSKNIQDILSANSSISGIYIYYKNIDLVTGNNFMYTKENFYEQKLKDSDLSYEEWTAMFDKNSYAVARLISHSRDNRQTVDFFYQIPAYLDQFDAMAVLSINADTLVNNAKMVTDIFSDIGMFIRSKDNEVIMTNGVMDVIPEKSKNCRIISTVSNTTGWNYIIAVPQKVFDKKFEYFKLVNLLNIIMCLILSGILSYFFAKMNARPFSTLKLIYNKDVENDMTLINKVLDDYRSAKQTQSELEQSHLMEMLINTGNPKILDELKRYNIYFPHQYFCVILFKLLNVSKLFEDENDISSLQKYDALNLIIKNTLEEIINEKHSAFICKINGQIVAVVNINYDYILEFRSELEKMLSRGREFISSNFAFSYTPFVGGIHDVKALHRSYSEAINALQYRTFIPTSDIVFCDDSNLEKNPLEISAVIPEEKAKQLVSLLQLGDAQTSLSVVNALLETASHDSAVKYNIFIFDLIGILIHVAESIEANDNDSRLLYELCSLAGNYDAPYVPEKINEIITELCNLSLKNNMVNETKEIEDNFSKKDIVSEIKQFIRQNFTNQTLNISVIGEYFNITPYYISNMFKKSEDISMLDYIGMTRIEKAKELLVTTDLNLESVALQCGFSNIRTFMRVFQKFEIIAPGKYRDINKK